MNKIITLLSILFSSFMMYAQQGQTFQISSAGATTSTDKIHGFYSLGDVFTGSGSANGYVSQGFVSAQTRLTTSIRDEDGTIVQVVVFPNPTIDKFFITTELDVVKVEMFDVKGQLIKSFQKTQFKEMGVSELISGSYAIRILTANNKSHHVGWINKI